MKKKKMPVQNWFLYDTFEGIPDGEIANKTWETRNKESYGPGTYSLEEVIERFKSFPQTKVIKGCVPNIFEEEPLPDAICFAHIDMNSAVAETAGLEIVYERLTAGGIILLDDHGWMQCGDQYTAHTKWATEHGIRVFELPTGQGLIFKN